MLGWNGLPPSRNRAPSLAAPKMGPYRLYPSIPVAHRSELIV
jgi:hypothetical protein